MDSLHSREVNNTDYELQLSPLKERNDTIMEPKQDLEQNKPLEPLKKGGDFIIEPTTTSEMHSHVQNNTMRPKPWLGNPSTGQPHTTDPTSSPLPQSPPPREYCTFAKEPCDGNIKESIWCNEKSENCVGDCGGHWCTSSSFQPVTTLIRRPLPQPVKPTTTPLNATLAKEDNHTQYVTLSSAAEPQNQEPRLWIYVDEYQEGMSSWLISLSELLIIAKRLNATIVEPCIFKGRLVRCGASTISRRFYNDQKIFGSIDVSQTMIWNVRKLNWKLKLGDVLSLNKMNEFHPASIASHDEFMSAMNDDSEVYTLCQIKRARHDIAINEIWKSHNETRTTKHQLFCIDGSRTHREKTNHAFEDAVAASSNQNVVLQFNQYWKNGWDSFIYNGEKLIPSLAPGVTGGNTNTYIDFVKLNYLKFQSVFYDIADSFLEYAGIVDDKYSVIQWRAEVLQLDYVSCANHIVTAKEILQSEGENKDNSSSIPFVLMSSLNKDKSTVWLGIDGGQDSEDALKILLEDNNFIKLDTYIDKLMNDYDVLTKDSVTLAVVDLIISNKAKEFVTCNRGCTSICSQCGHHGTFNRYASDLRLNDKKRVIDCWPEISD